MNTFQNIVQQLNTNSMHIIVRWTGTYNFLKYIKRVRWTWNFIVYDVQNATYSSHGAPCPAPFPWLNTRDKVHISLWTIREYPNTLLRTSRIQGYLLTIESQGLDTELDFQRIMSGFHGSFATGVACQQGTLALSDTWFRPRFGGLACALIVRTSFPEFTPIWRPYPTWLSPNWEVSMEHCDGCGILAGSAYPSGHLVPSPFLGLAGAPIVETRFLELAVSLLDFSCWTPVGTFSLLLQWYKKGLDKHLNNIKNVLTLAFDCP